VAGFAVDIKSGHAYHLGMMSWIWWHHRTVAYEIRRLSMWFRRPQAVRVTLIRKESDMALVYQVSAGPVVDHDVVTRRLIVTVNGEKDHEEDFSPETVLFGEIVVPQDSQVVLSLTDIDDANNASEPATVEFTALDTIPPARPGEFGVTLLREIPD
jgi:hypothetical protein